MMRAGGMRPLVIRKDRTGQAQAMESSALQPVVCLPPVVREGTAGGLWDFIEIHMYSSREYLRQNK